MRTHAEIEPRAAYRSVEVKMRATTISKEVHKGSQSVTLTEVISVLVNGKKHKLRITIKSDAYRQQCYARVKRWTGSTWNEVHHILDMKTPEGLKHQRDVGEADFKDDRNELLRVAERVLA
jgi:hypothetical protein